MTEATSSGVPIGPLVDARHADRPARIVLSGRSIRLVPLDAALHAEGLYAATHEEVSAAQREAVWAYMGDGPYPDRTSFIASVEAKAASSDPLFYALVDLSSGRVLGHATLMRIDPVNRVVEVGNIVYSPALQRTRGATEAIYLFARYVFDTLGYRRFEWKCNALNAPSRRAALRFGFVFEGVFRQHMIIKGRNRDTAWFAMLDQEWPARRAAFERWLADDNFDAKGRQRQPLGAFMPAAADDAQG